MLWFLVIHIIALLFWCAALLYLPVLIAQNKKYAMARFIFTHIASPSALIAITAGTALFLLTDAVAFWLIFKLGLVAGLVVGHALAGLLLLRVESKPGKPVLLKCWILGISFAGLIAAIIWTVLAKPELAGGLT